MPAGVLLFSPWTDLSCSGETIRTKVDVDVMFEPARLVEVAALHLNGRPADEPLASPLFADQSCWPEMLVFASEYEILLADATRLHKKMQHYGRCSTLITRRKMPHVWPVMLMMPEALNDLRIAGDFVSRVTGSREKRG